MSKSYWRGIANSVIARVHDKVPWDATLAERIAAIDAARPHFGGASWPTRMWQEQRRAYLAKFGYRPRQSAGPTALDLLPRDPVTGRPTI